MTGDEGAVWAYIEPGSQRRTACGWCGRRIEYARSVTFGTEVPFEAPLRVGPRGRVDLRQIHIWCKQRKARHHARG